MDFSGALLPMYHFAMISTARSSRTGLLSRMKSLVYYEKRNARLRPPAFHPAASAAVAQKAELVDGSEHATVIASFGCENVFVCWHPPKPFPYEHTKPIERTEDELRQGKGPLRADIQLQFKAGRQIRGAAPPDLPDMFYTDRRAFWPKHREARIDETCEPPPVDRKGL